MARTDLTVTTIDRDGVDMEATLEAANTDGEMFQNDGKTFIVVKNTNASNRTVTVVTPRTIDGLAVSDLTVTVSQNEEMFIGPFPKDTFNQKSGSDAGKVYVNFSAVTDVTVAAFRM